MGVNRLDWVCYIGGEDLGDFAEVASGDCVKCGRIVCELHYEYDEQTGEVTCDRCAKGGDVPPAGPVVVGGSRFGPIYGYRGA